MLATISHQILIYFIKQIINIFYSYSISTGGRPFPDNIFSQSGGVIKNKVMLYITVRLKKNVAKNFCDISKSYCPNAQIFIGQVENIHKFFSENFGGRNFEPRRNFWEKPTNGIFQKMTKSDIWGQKISFQPKYVYDAPHMLNSCTSTWQSHSLLTCRDLISAISVDLSKFEFS